MLSYLRFATRSLRQSPTFTLTVVATLAIGIGLNAAIFTVVDDILLRPLGYRDADRIVAIRTHFNEENRSIPRLGGDDITDLARDVHSLDATAIYQGFSDGIQLHGTSFYVPVALVAPRFTEIMGVQPVVGRLFHPADQDGTDVLLSTSFVQQHFASATEAIGESIAYNGKLYTVAGVLPSGFSFPDQTEVWFERSALPTNHNRTSYSDRVLARRSVGVLPAALSSELATFSANLQRHFPEDKKKSIEAVSLQEQIVGKLRPTLNLLMGSVAVILLIVCANITHLQLVRATRQLRSTTIRAALGASRSTLAARVLLETMLLGFAGSVVALMLALPALKAMVYIAPADAPRLTEIHLNAHVFLFSILLSLLVMVVTSLLPVWRSWHIDPASVLRADSSRGTELPSSVRLRNTFIVAQVGLTLTLSVAAVMLTRQLIEQSRQQLGFSPESLLVLDAHAVLTTPSPQSNDTSPTGITALQLAERAFDQAKLNRLDATLVSIAETPGVNSAAAIDGAPMGFGGSDVRYSIHGRQSPDNLRPPNADIRPITPGFFATLGVPLLQGRAFVPADRSGSQNVVIINTALARQSFPGQDPLGQQIDCGYDRHSDRLLIVGITADIRADSPAAPPTPTLYVPVAQHPNPASDMQFVVRTALAPALLADTLRTRLLQAHPDVAVKISTMRQNVSMTQQTERFRTILFTLFAAVSILLAAIGMYGVTAYTVAQRRFEFGLRIALGATRPQVLTMVLRNALAIAAIGIATGILLSLALTRLVASVVGKLPAFDFISYLLASTAVLSIAILATLLPSHRAATVEPMSILRSE